MNAKFVHDGTALTVYLSGELDHHEAGPLREQIDLAIDRFMPQLLILDFSDVPFMDSSAIGLALGRYHILKRNDGAVRLTGLTSTYYRMMCLSNLNAHMEVVKK